VDAKAKRIEIAQRSLYGFCSIYLKHMMTHPCGEFHKRLCQNIERASKPGGRLAGLISRGHAKTTYGTFGVALREICLAGYKGKMAKDNILLIAANEEEAKGKMETIHAELDENDLLRHDFGDAIAPKKRPSGMAVKNSQGELQCNNGVRIAARPILGKVRGRNIRHNRVKLIIIDDPEDDDNVASKKWRDRVENWVNKTLMNTFDPYNDSLIWLGTLTHFDSPLARMIKSKKGWITFQEDCANEWKCGDWVPPDDLQLLWPEYWTFEKLKKRESDIASERGYGAFLQEFMNIPINPEDQVYRPENWRYYDVSRLHEVNGQYWIAPMSDPANWTTGH